MPLANRISQLKLSTFAGALAIGLVFASSMVSAADRAHTVIVAGAGSVNTLDPVASNYAQTNDLVSRLYSPLITYDLDLNVIGDLASSYKVAPDAKSMSFTIRSGATFHDGKPVTSKDVAFSLDRIKKLGIGAASYLDGYDSTEIADDANFTIKLSKPSSLFLNTLSRVYILNSALVTANTGTDNGQAWLANHEAGSGPYKLTSMNGDVVMDWYDGYWAKREKRPMSFVFRRVDESAPKREELKIGNIDVARNVLQRDLDVLAKEQGVTVTYGGAPAVNGIYFNTQVGPTADPKVRKAITLAYDYAGGLAGIHRGHGSLPYGPLPDTLACRPKLPVVARDVPKAKALLAEAGQKDLTLTLRFQPSFEEQVQEATLLQSNLKEIGVTLKLEPIAFPNYLTMLQDKTQIPQMMLLSENAFFPDPGVMLTKTYMSNATGTNRSGYSNPKIDDMLQKAIASANPDERCTIYQDAQKIINDDSVFMPIYWSGTFAAFRGDRLADPLAKAISGNFAPLAYPTMSE